MGIDKPTPEEAAPQEGGAEKERKIWLPRPEGYVEPTQLPKFEVAKVHSGAGTFAPNLGERYSFASEEEARAYIEFAREQNFQGTVQLTRWDTMSERGAGRGEVLEDAIEIK